MVTSYITEIQYQDQKTNMGTSVVTVKDLTEISKSQNKLLKIENYSNLFKIITNNSKLFTQNYSREWKEHLE